MSAITTYHKLIAQLDGYRIPNLLAERYYEGEQRVPLLNIATPPLMNGIRIAVGWPGTQVDVLHERCDWYGWSADGKLGFLNEVYENNQLGYEVQLGTHDSLLYGTSFLSVGTGDPRIGEPSTLVTVDSAKDMTGYYNRRSRRFEAAAKRVYDPSGKWTQGVLYEPYETTYLTRSSDTAPWRVDWVDKHNLGRVPVFDLPNRTRAGRRQGASEITKTVRSYTNMAVRTLMGMEVNREFFSAPQRYALGAKEDAFTDENGNPIPGWRTIMGSLWNLERDEEWVEDHPGSDGLPTIGEFSPNPPGPYIEQITGLSKMFAAEVGIPPSYLGFVSENAPSADAIRALEARLVKRAERRITVWDSSLRSAGQLIAFLETGEEPPMGDILSEWADPAVPARGADTDRAVKLTQSGILPPHSEVTYSMVGLSPSQRKQLKRDESRQAMLDLLRGGGNDGSTEPDGDGPTTESTGEADGESTPAGME